MVSFFTEVINRLLPEPNASLVNGIIFGVPLKVDLGFYNEVKTVGLLHIVVLSGMNMNVLAAIVIGLTRGLGRRTSLLIAILTLTFFLIFVGPQAPIARAYCTSMLTIVALILGRKPLALYLLIISFIVILILQPAWITTLSLQLSYGATLGILLFNRVITQKGLIGYCKSELTTSFAAQVFTTPLIFFTFKQVSFISPISNLLVSWTIAPIMIFGALTAMLGKIHPFLAFIPNLVSYLLSEYMIIVIDMLSRIPYAFASF